MRFATHDRAPAGDGLRRTSSRWRGRRRTAGFEALFRSDHYTSFPGEEGLRTTDAWTTLAGLARETSRIRLGTLVSPMTFRDPGLAGQGGGHGQRDERRAHRGGLGAGWNEKEHAELGIPYPEDKVRVDILEETLQLFHGLWDEPDGWTMDGEHVKVTGSLFRPKDRRPPILVGGSGRPRSLRLAATYADEHNLSSATPAQAVEVNAEAGRAVREGGTRPEDAGPLGDDRRAHRDGMRRTWRAGPHDQLADVRGVRRDGASRGWTRGATGGRWAPPDEARARVQALADAGIERVMLQTFLPFDLDHITLMGEVFLG